MVIICGPFLGDGDETNRSRYYRFEMMSVNCKVLFLAIT